MVTPTCSSPWRTFPPPSKNTKVDMAINHPPPRGDGGPAGVVGVIVGLVVITALYPRLDGVVSNGWGTLISFAAAILAGGAVMALLGYRPK